MPGRFNSRLIAVLSLTTHGYPPSSNCSTARHFNPCLLHRDTTDRVPSQSVCHAPTVSLSGRSPFRHGRHLFTPMHSIQTADRRCDHAVLVSFRAVSQSSYVKPGDHPFTNDSHASNFFVLQADLPSPRRMKEKETARKVRASRRERCLSDEIVWLV